MIPLAQITEFVPGTIGILRLAFWVFIALRVFLTIGLLTWAIVLTIRFLLTPLGTLLGTYKYVVFYEHAYDSSAATGSGPSFYDKNGNRVFEMHRLAHPHGHRNGWEDKVSSFDEAN